ncbi:MAG: response regulator transcription factor [Chloroflexota bacterium]|nr:response regulator transcription factor [Chloroflexota bacterium]
MSGRRFRILVADDEPRIHNFLRAKFKALGYDILTAADGIQALELVQAQEPDMVVLDIVMPGKDGFETLRELRMFSEIPVIVLSARQDDADKIEGLALGADDYLPKPFNPDELVARIEAIRRRTSPSNRHTASEAIILGDVTIDFKKRNVIVGDEVRNLTRIEWLLLSELASNIGRLLLYDDLLTRVWGPEYRNDVQILRTWMSRLRSKLKKTHDSPDIIRTIPKTGYIMEHPSSQ